MGDYYSDGVFRIGAAFLFDKHMQVDASLGKNLKNTPGILNAGIGFSWRFADQYQEVQIAKPGTESKTDKKMKKKGEKEAKKRKDAVE